MHLSLLLAQKIAVMFLMMFCGFMVVKLKILKSEDSKILANLCMYVVIPCMIIDAFQIECTPERLHDFLAMLGVSALAHVVFIGVTMLIRKPVKLRRIEQLSLIYPNCGNLILPLVASVFGDEMVFFATPYVCLQTIMVWTHGRAVICGGEGKFDPKKIFLNINVICTLLGLALFIFKIELPSIIGDACDSLGGIIGPISMLLTGMLIGGADLKKVFSQGHCYLISAMRLILYPVLLILAIKLTGMTGLTSSPDVPMITLLAASAPSATTITNLAQVYNSDPEIAATVNIITMVCCILTMPLINLLYQVVLL
ncbi:MAG: AEC family transporter [Clostridia bacterium]|nr:AEC family transporter [Clostridia bacterium]